MPQFLLLGSNANLWQGWRYFFMEITKSNRIVINKIMYSLSIVITPFRGDDDIVVRAKPKQASGHYHMGAVHQIKDLDSTPNRPAYYCYKVLPLCRNLSTTLF